MKKITALFLVVLALLPLNACAGDSTPSSSTPSLTAQEPSSEVSSHAASTQEPTATPAASATPEPASEPTSQPEPTPEPDNGSKVLIAYFSATGTTRPLAEYLADGLGADLYEIIPEEPYTDADLNYNDSGSRTSIEMNDPNSRPAISGSVEDIGQYDVVFVGYPIWWGDAPHILYTFMESYDWSGKTVIPFCTSGGSGIGSSGANLESLTSGAVWMPGQRLNSGASQEDVMEWVGSLGLDLSVGG